MNPKDLKKLIRGFKAEMRTMLAACKDPKTGQVREMTPDESTRFDELEGKVESHDRMLERLEAAGDEPEEEAAEGEDEGGEQGGQRSGRSSNPDQFGGQSPGIHTRKHSYSILRSLRAALKGHAPDGLEGEVSKEVRRFAKGKEFKGQFSMPIDPSPELRAIMYPRYSQRTDLTTTSGTGGIFTVPEMPMIDLLRARLVMTRLGVTLLTGMQGLFAIPRQSGKSTVNWIAEGSSSGNSTPTLDQVPFSPKVAVDIVNISRQFLNQTSVSAEAFVLNDLAKSMAVEWDRVSFVGTGSGANQPLGVAQNSTIQTNSAGIAIGTNGGPLTWASVVNMESQVANYNADSGKLAYLTNPTQRGKLKQVPKGSASTFPLFIWEDGTEPGVGKVNSYPAYATTNIPANGTKGSGTGLSDIIFGNWEDLVVASWDDGIDFLVNPYSNQASAAVLISMEMSVDSEVRHPESFALISDAL